MSLKMPIRDKRYIEKKTSSDVVVRIMTIEFKVVCGKKLCVVYALFRSGVKQFYVIYLTCHLYFGLNAFSFYKSNE